MSCSCCSPPPPILRRHHEKYEGSEVLDGGERQDGSRGVGGGSSGPRRDCDQIDLLQERIMHEQAEQEEQQEQQQVEDQGAKDKDKSKYQAGCLQLQGLVCLQPRWQFRRCDSAPSLSLPAPGFGLEIFSQHFGHRPTRSIIRGFCLRRSFGFIRSFGNLTGFGISRGFCITRGFAIIRGFGIISRFAISGFGLITGFGPSCNEQWPDCRKAKLAKPAWKGENQ